MTYVTLGKPRITISETEDGETLVIWAQMDILLLFGLPVWIGAWTLAGFAAARQFLVAFDPFFAFWLFFWAMGWLGAAFVLSWMLTGRQRLRLIGADLEIETLMLGFKRRTLYRGRAIWGLKVLAGRSFWQARHDLPMSLLRGTRGSGQFGHGDRTHSTGFGLDEPEALAVIDWLSKKLPQAST